MRLGTTYPPNESTGKASRSSAAAAGRAFGSGWKPRKGAKQDGAGNGKDAAHKQHQHPKDAVQGVAKPFRAAPGTHTPAAHAAGLAGDVLLPDGLSLPQLELWPELPASERAQLERGALERLRSRGGRHMGPIALQPVAGGGLGERLPALLCMGWNIACSSFYCRCCGWAAQGACARAHPCGCITPAFFQGPSLSLDVVLSTTTTLMSAYGPHPLPPHCNPPQAKATACLPRAMCSPASCCCCPRRT